MTMSKLEEGGKSSLRHHSLAPINANQLQGSSSSFMFDICLARARRCNFAALRNISWLNALRDLDRSWPVC